MPPGAGNHETESDSLGNGASIRSGTKTRYRIVVGVSLSRPAGGPMTIVSAAAPAQRRPPGKPAQAIRQAQPASRRGVRTG